MTENENKGDEKEKLRKAFLLGFIESAEGWNGEMMEYNTGPYMRRLKARFDALYDSGRFDEPLSYTSD